MENAPSISIFIPAYNARDHIASVMERIPQPLWEDINKVWIIDDGSTDDTGMIIEELKEKYHKLNTIHFNRNKGYGETVKQGLQECKNDGSDIVICLHADGQYPPESIPEILDYMIQNKLDLVQGSRIASGTALSGGMPLYKYVANRILTFFENLVFGLNMSDYHSGFMFYNQHTLNSISIGNLSSSFDFDLEMIATAKSLNLKIGEHPIPTHYADEVSYLNPITYGFRVLGVMWNYMQGHYRILN